MLSRAETEFLKNPSAFDSNYSKALKFRLRQKVTELQEEISLLRSAGFMEASVTKNSNPVTVFSNPQITPNQAAMYEIMQQMVGLPGFEPGSIEPKSTSLDQTSRQPLLSYAFSLGRCRET
jgi:hypothetical protein